MNRFSHIYIEEEACKSPATKEILSKYPNSIKISISNYKHIFNRPNQDFQAQKESAKLILAVQKDFLFYKETTFTNHSSNENYYYTTLIQNCKYNCGYCYLQGMYHSGNIVVFVNLEDYFLEMEKLLADTSVYLFLSKETDLLAFEDMIPYTSSWIEFAKSHPNLTLDIQTKSNNFKFIQNLIPSKNIILSWSVSPEEVIEKYEKNTPSLESRLQNVHSAIKAGWNVRICIDPILRVKNWKEIYGNLVKNIFLKMKSEKPFTFHLETLRIHSNYLKKMKKVRSKLDILYYPFERIGNFYGYPKNKRIEMIDFLSGCIANYYVNC